MGGCHWGQPVRDFCRAFSSVVTPGFLLFDGTKRPRFENVDAPQPLNA